MGVDSFIFDEVSKTCFYFDRKYNFILCGSGDARHEDIIDHMDSSERGRATSEEVVYACDFNIAYWEAESEHDAHRAEWNRSIKRFAQERPEGSFFTASDHDYHESHEIKRAGKYKEVYYECPKCGGPLEDYRNAGFSSDALREQQTCYTWGVAMYTCNHKFPEPKPETAGERTGRLASIEELVKALEAGGYRPGASK